MVSYDETTAAANMHYRLQDPPGSTIIVDDNAADGSWSGNPLTVAAGPRPWLPSAVHFDGTNRIATASNPGGANRDGSIAAWVRPTSHNGIRYIMDTRAGSSGFILRVNSGAIQCLLGYSSGFSTISPGMTVPLNQWTHVAVTWKNGSGQANAYVNGVLTASSPHTVNAGIVDYLSGNLGIGGQGDGA